MGAYKVIMLSETAEQILKTKYYKRGETFDQLCLRVAYVVAGAEKTDEERNHWAAKYYQLMQELWFLPAGRILANAGSKTKNLYNCYTHSIEDSRESIYRTLANTAEIFAHGGGVGVNFSKLRERGAPVSNGSAASGPISFMHVFDKSADVISQASRRGAMLALLEIDHPDIEGFIRAKDEEGILTYFNLSVGLTDYFMNMVEEDEDFDLISRYFLVDGEVPIDARTLFDSIAEHAWKSGDPGFIYIDRLEEDNATPHTGRLETTNPCGETPLRDEACCLASINLTKMLTKIDGDWIFDKKKFVYTVSIVTRFLDSVHDVSQAPIPEIDEKIMGARRIGLGIFGWADILAMMGIPYESDTALYLAERISAIMKQATYDTSVWLAEEKGAYPAFDPEKSRNIWYPSEPVLPTRNAMLLSLAPTGCYDEETEVLTKDGWKYFRDVSYSDEFMSYNKDSETWEYQIADEIFESDYDGPMYHFKHRSYDLLVTPEHRMFKRTCCTWPETEIVAAKDINNFPLVIPQKGIWEGETQQFFRLPRMEKSWIANNNGMTKVWEEVAIPIEVWLQFLGYYLSEGSCNHSNTIYITQLKEPSRTKMFDDLSKLPFVVSEAGPNIRITSRQICEYVKPFGTAKEKRVPQFIKELSPELISIFLDAYILGDGHRKCGRSTEIYTASKLMADDLQELFIKMGSRATISHKTREYRFEHGAHGWSTCYTIREIKRDTSWVRKRNVNIVDYKGKIYCVSVPNTLVLVRRNGFTTICGNSISLLANTNGGIEPFFALAYRKNVTTGSGETKYQLVNTNQYLLAYLDRLVDTDTKEKVLNHLELTGEIQSLDYLPAKLRELFKTAHDISPEFRVKIQAAWQKNVDGAISSTVNLPNSATVEAIKDIIMLGWKLGLKGLTVFRDGCKRLQILEVGTKSNCNCEACGI